MTLSQSLAKYLEAYRAHTCAELVLRSAEDWLVDAMLHRYEPSIKGDGLEMNLQGYNIKLTRSAHRWVPTVSAWKLPAEPPKNVA